MINTSMNTDEMTSSRFVFTSENQIYAKYIVLYPIVHIYFASAESTHSFTLRDVNTIIQKA